MVIIDESNINSPDQNNNLPLHHAVMQNDLPLVHKLILSGSYKNCLNKSFDSPVHIAVRLGHLDVLRELVDQGCDVNVCDPYFNVTPLHVAVNVYNDYIMFKKMFKILLDGGCLLNCRAFSTLETPLYRAIDTMKTEIAELFLVHGADPNLSSPFDITALQKACIRGNTHLVKLLLHCGIQWKKERWLPQENVQSLSFSGSIQIKDLILKWRSTVPSLQYLCRIRTRYFLEENLEYKLSNIVIPKHLKDFILFSDLRQFCD